MEPRFTRLLEDQRVMEQDNAEFYCEVYPVLSPVTWHMKEQVLKQNTSQFDMSSDGAGRRLRITKAQESDAGLVKAVVGTTDSIAELTVEGECPLTYIQVAYNL